MVSIRERREALGLSQTELAEAVGISAKSLSRYESGERDPRASDLVKIADALGCSVELLVNPTLHRESRPGDRKRKAGAEPVKRNRRKRSAA